MSDNTEAQVELETSADLEIFQDERASLIRQADAMGVSFHPNISTDKLRERVVNALNGTDAQSQAPLIEAAKTESENERRIRLRAEASKLIRVHVTCMDPMKKEYQGEIITAGNSIVGSYRKFVLFNEAYHLPYIILKQLEDKQCQIFTTAKNDRGQSVRKSKLIKAYSIQYLPQLTAEELAELAADQRARKAV